MTYQTPIRDIMFHIEHLSSWPPVTSFSPLLMDRTIDTLLVSGRWFGTINLPDPQAESDLGRVCSKAEPQGDRFFVSLFDPNFQL